MLFDPEEHKVYAFHKIEDTRCAQLKAIWNKGLLYVLHMTGKVRIRFKQHIDKAWLKIHLLKNIIKKHIKP